jgi:hypothetical protein
VVISQEFKIIYFHMPDGDLYRYEVTSNKLTYLFNETGEDGSSSPDGSFYYFQGSVAGVPGGNQVFLYNASQDMVECVSCASPYDSEPKLGAFVPQRVSGELGPLQEQNGSPREIFISDSGEYAFFDTPAALVPSDVDGEVPPDPSAGAEYQSGEYSLSSDVYEWRKDGLDGCAQVQGCVALITNGRGGYLNLLIGMSPSGSNVFIYTRSELVKQDNDNSGDIYDVRIDGGFPPPSPRPTECEGSECSNPIGLPIDSTPASLTFSGAGNVTVTEVKSKGKTKKKKNEKKKAKKKKKAKSRTSMSKTNMHKVRTRPRKSRRLSGRRSR